MKADTVYQIKNDVWLSRLKANTRMSSLSTKQLNSQAHIFFYGKVHDDRFCITPNDLRALINFRICGRLTEYEGHKVLKISIRPSAVFMIFQLAACLFATLFFLILVASLITKSLELFLVSSATIAVIFLVSWFLYRGEKEKVIKYYKPIFKSYGLEELNTSKI